MTIKEVCTRTGLTADTLRYYEKAGMIPRVGRTPGGTRDYTDADLGWIEMAKCMRSAGLPVEVMVEYLRLCLCGDETMQARLDLLKAQLVSLEAQKSAIESTIARLTYKIGRYEEAVRTGKLTWPKV